MMTSRVAKRQAERAKQRIVLELENRTLMLCVHGLILMMLGMMMIPTGAPIPTEEWFGPSARLVVGGAGVLAGATLLAGVALGDESRRGYFTLLAGALGAALWHFGLSATYAYATLSEEIAVLAPGETLGAEVTNRGYIPFVYLGYVLLVVLHARTLIKLGLPPR